MATAPSSWVITFLAPSSSVSTLSLIVLFCKFYYREKKAAYGVRYTTHLNSFIEFYVLMRLAKFSLVSFFYYIKILVYLSNKDLLFTLSQLIFFLLLHDRPALLLFLAAKKSNQKKARLSY
jgi:hypothetical protein